MSYRWKGPALPWKGTLRSLLEGKDDINVLKSSVIWIILTSQGERVMEPEFGSDLLRFLFNPASEDQVAQVRDSIREAIHRWDDRVEFVDAEVKIEEHTVRCRVLFKNAKDPKQDTVQVVEFQLAEGQLYF